MSLLVSIAITTGILSGVWGWLSASLGLLSWAGFLGCTTVFASPQDGMKGLLLSISTNLSGVFWCIAIIKSSSIFHLEIMGYVATAIVATLMCVQAKQAWLSFIPGTFIGCCATFAANGDWKAVVPALIVGAIFGYLMKTTGILLHKKVSAKKEN